MQRRSILRRLSGIAFAALTVAAAHAAAAEELKVGFIYVGPISDHGWSYQHDQGRQAIEKALGDRRKRDNTTAPDCLCV